MRPDPEQLDRGYLCYYLRSSDFVRWISGQVNGAKMPRVNMRAFWEHEIPLPTLEEQKRIAAILDKADALRRKRAQALQLTDQFLQSLFLDMFGDVRGKDSPYEFLPIRPYVTARSGKSSAPVVTKEETGIPIYGGNGINGWSKEALYEEPVVVAGRVGQQCGIIHFTEGPAWVTDNAIVLKVDDHERIDPIYLGSVFQHASIRETVKHLDLPFINQSMLLDHPIPLPPIEAQREYVRTREFIISQQRKNQHTALEQATNLFGSLTQRAFRGEL